MVSSSSARAARERAKQLRAEQERKERRGKIARRTVLGVGGVAILGGTAGLVFYGRSHEGSGGAKGKAASAGDVDYTKLDETSLKSKLANRKGVPKLVLVDGSLPFGKGPVPGTMNTGTKNVIEVVFDYACSHCAEFESVHAAELKGIIDTGKATVVLRPCKILGQNWTDIVMNAMGVVLDEQPEMALTFHNAALALISEIFASRDAGRQTDDELADTAKKAGVSQDVVKAFEKAVKDNSYGKWTEAGTNAFKDKKLSATPTVFLADTQLNLQAIATATALTEAVAKRPAATATPTEAASGAPTGAATETPAEGGAEGGAGAPAAPSPEPAE